MHLPSRREYGKDDPCCEYQCYSNPRLICADYTQLQWVEDGKIIYLGHCDLENRFLTVAEARSRLTELLTQISTTETTSEPDPVFPRTQEGRAALKQQSAEKFMSTMNEKYNGFDLVNLSECDEESDEQQVPPKLIRYNNNSIDLSISTIYRARPDLPGTCLSLATESEMEPITTIKHRKKEKSEKKKKTKNNIIEPATITSDQRPSPASITIDKRKARESPELAFFLNYLMSTTLEKIYCHYCLLNSYIFFFHSLILS